MSFTDRIKQENSQANSQKGPRNLQYNVSLNEEKEGFTHLVIYTHSLIVVCILRAKDGQAGGEAGDRKAEQENMWLEV